MSKPKTLTTSKPKTLRKSKKSKSKPSYTESPWGQMLACQQAHTAAKRKPRTTTSCQVQVPCPNSSPLPPSHLLSANQASAPSAPQSLSQPLCQRSSRKSAKSVDKSA
ncbi:hypothetical protein MJO28_011628 [Puccinia striiformis f. sp. tritici]|uniref:Uncharacterized protein n=1 Tax=Puccinia striiformis f. sp. tritici TaxID=168172 RepID=A0ACC0E2N7_9BASI|nr:hypothetical protein MJO28_011628 [Puccinia striiformis f. sp. tritici]